MRQNIQEDMGSRSTQLVKLANFPDNVSVSIGGKGCRRCGSTTHQRSSHRDCPFNKKNKRLGNENNNEENDSQHYTQHVLSWNLKLLFPPEAEVVLIITLNMSSLDLWTRKEAESGCIFVVIVENIQLLILLDIYYFINVSILQLVIMVQYSTLRETWWSSRSCHLPD